MPLPVAEKRGFFVGQTVRKESEDALNTGRQGEDKAENVSVGTSVRDGEVVSRGALLAVQRENESRSGAGAELPCLQPDKSDQHGGSAGSDRGCVRGNAHFSRAKR